MHIAHVKIIKIKPQTLYPHPKLCIRLQDQSINLIPSQATAETWIEKLDLLNVLNGHFCYLTSASETNQATITVDAFSSYIVHGGILLLPSILVITSNVCSFNIFFQLRGSFFLFLYVSFCCLLQH